MKTKYYKENQHNFLVIEGEGLQEQTYEKRMLLRQKIKYIFPCTIRIINGKENYYYEITSKVSMINLFQSKEMAEENIRNLFLDLQRAQNELTSYWLDESKIVLSPQYIFYNYETNHYDFLYYPMYQTSDNMYSELLDYLLEVMESSNKAFVEKIYNIYEEAEGGTLSIDRITTILDEKNDTQEIALEHLQEKKEIEAEIEPEILSEPYITNEKSSGKRFYILLIIFSLLGEMGLGTMAYYFAFTETELVVMLSAAISFLGMTILGLVFLWKQIIVDRKKQIYNTELKIYREEEFVPAKQPSYSEVQLKDFTFPMNHVSFIQEEAVGSELLAEQTEYFVQDKKITEYKLFAHNREMGNHIPLDKLPCTIGKLIGYTDYSIDDKTISKIHAKIDCENNQLLLQDLNSTNGTFLNGVRLEPNEQLEIFPGDEIRFGRVVYYLR